jgi:hypothetical protein
MIACTRCGASNQPTSKFCLSCGNPLAAAAAPAPGYGAPQPAAAPAQPAPQPAPAWGAQPAQPAPQPYGAPPPQPWQPQQPPGAYGAPPPPPGAWAPPPPDQGGFAPAPVGGFAPATDDRARFGSPEGMNPFSATVAPDFSAGGAPPPGPPGYGTPPPAPQGYGAPQPQAYAAPPPQAYAPQAYGAPPPQAYGAPAPQAPAQWQPPTPPPAQQAVPPRPNAPTSGAHSHDPSVFAATAPPPTTDEYEAAVRRSQAPVAQAPAPGPSSPPVAAAPPPAPLGPGRDPELVEAGAIRSLAGFFVSFDQSEFGVFWPIYQGQNVLGRKGAGAGLDIEIDSPTTSSRHATVYASARPGRIKLEDGGSTNGTFLNDAPLERGRKYELRDNDTLRFGGFNVIVKII